jgi:Phage integrase, N-terminal SAM-like domain
MASQNDRERRRRTIHRYHRNHGEAVLAMPEQNQTGLLSPLVTEFLAELAQANRSRHTCRAYATDLAQFAAFYRGPVGGITVEVLRSFGATLESLRPTSRATRSDILAATFLGFVQFASIVTLPLNVHTT